MYHWLMYFYRVGISVSNGDYFWVEGPKYRASTDYDSKQIHIKKATYVHITMTDFYHLQVMIKNQLENQIRMYVYACTNPLN